MMRSFRVPFISDHMREYGSHGLLPNAAFSCGWSLITGVGQLTGLLGEDFPTRPNVCCVTRNRKASNTS
jgi:hypothetical protein